MTTTAPFGAWRSPITADLLVQKVVSLSSVQVSGEDVYWVEARPAEAGRQVIVRRRADGSTADVVPPGFSARTLVHEYGGRSFAVAGGIVYFSNQADQRLYRLDPPTSGPPIEDGDGPAGEPVALTPEPPSPMALRYADPVVSADGAWVVCVRERHLGGEAVNDLVAIPAGPSGGGDEPVVLAAGHDFFSAPRLSPDGASLCWLAWDHPNMPWDGTELWRSAYADGRLSGEPRLVAGGPAESVSQPRWAPDGTLHFASDRSGWWNLYAERSGGVEEVVEPMAAEFSGPDWVFGQSTYAFAGDGSLVVVWSQAGRDRLGVVVGGRVEQVEQPFTALDSLQSSPGSDDGGGITVLAVAGSPSTAPAVVRIVVPSGEVMVLKRSREATVDGAYLSSPEPIEFPTEGGQAAHALFYPPANADFAAPAGERPPLVVMSHGGPTSSASSTLNLGLQFWTSRGFAVVDVDYGGSSGYGREYRRRLDGRWGIVDVDDCVNAARWLAGRGRVDGERMVIRGGSAGGYTTLAALTFRDVFAGGASHYGVADVEALATDTHKFESRYLDGLIGPYPEAKAVYDERSPIHHTDRLSRPMILFQGLEDRIVPPAQADMMAAALRAKGIPFTHLAFDGEQHGFRRSETIKRVAEAELAFYGRVLGFVPADELGPLAIENEEALSCP